MQTLPPRSVLSSPIFFHSQRCSFTRTFSSFGNSKLPLSGFSPFNSHLTHSTTFTNFLPFVQTCARGSYIQAILAKDVRGVGIKYQRVWVRPGFFKGFLFPTGRAVPYTPENSLLYPAEKIDHAKIEQQKTFRSLKRRLGKMKLKILRHVPRRPWKPPTFGQKEEEEPIKLQPITEQVVSDKIRIQFAMEIRPNCIRLPPGINTVGEHEVTIVQNNVEVPMIVEVVKRN
eukprot:TRINITY_DN6175_c0_g1_i1.p1 TRINITY_DN6175_c0_g1~~TRINITY_DN6175_c0_g1_i1.p1  ORF type:complete len:229 (-),score=44.22 TRINITY_DN6175_c0_g1_i1:14-700(-)